jgi:hemerythrin-like domain-containing protein
VSKAIEDLRHEHEAILSALGVLDAIVSQLATGTAVTAGHILEFMAFLSEFADKCHHGKEEGILFPELKRAAVPEEKGAVALMLAEHAQGRALIKAMGKAAEGAPDYPRFVGAAREYSSLLRNHIQQEERVLFPTAEKALTDPQLERIYRSFEEHEEQVIGPGRHEQLHDMLRRLQQEYSAR